MDSVVVGFGAIVRYWHRVDPGTLGLGLGAHYLGQESAWSMGALGQPVRMGRSSRTVGAIWGLRSYSGSQGATCGLRGPSSGRTAGILAPSASGQSCAIGVKCTFGIRA